MKVPEYRPAGGHAPFLSASRRARVPAGAHWPEAWRNTRADWLERREEAGASRRFSGDIKGGGARGERSH